MATGSARLAKQVGPRGYFGEVELDVMTSNPQGRAEVEFDSGPDKRWESGVRFGVEYVLEGISKPKHYPNGMTIHIKRVKGHDVDTTNTLIAYLTADALLQALGIPDTKRKPQFVPENGQFVFPK